MSDKTNNNDIIKKIFKGIALLIGVVILFVIFMALLPALPIIAGIGVLAVLIIGGFESGWNIHR